MLLLNIVLLTFVMSDSLSIIMMCFNPDDLNLATPFFRSALLVFADILCLIFNLIMNNNTIVY